MSSLDMWPGAPYPLGATYDGGGTNFAIFSEVAERIELCLFDDDGQGDPVRPARARRAWSGTATCRGSGPGSATATACTARTTPAAGLRCNPAKLLLDPYAKAIDGQIGWDEALFSYRFGDHGAFNDARLGAVHHDARW